MPVPLYPYQGIVFRDSFGYVVEGVLDCFRLMDALEKRNLQPGQPVWYMDTYYRPEGIERVLRCAVAAERTATAFGAERRVLYTGGTRIYAPDAMELYSLAEPGLLHAIASRDVYLLRPKEEKKG